jgi:hypothetical protein
MLFPAGIPVNFTAVFNNPTPSRVALSVYDDTGATPVLLLSPVAMNQVNDNVYSGKFTPENGKQYVVFMAVYTDATFVTLDNSFKTAEQSVSVIAQYLTPQVQGVIGKVSCEGQSQPTPNTFKIFRGDEKTISLLVFDTDNNGLPVDLSSATEIDLALPNADGTVKHLLLSTGDVSLTVPAILGGFSALITDVVSTLLNVGEYQNLDATITLPNEVFTVRFQGGLSVFEVK